MPDALSIFGKVASKDSKASKSKTPAVEAPGLEESIKNWRKADKDLDDAKSRKDLAETVILPAAEELRLKESRREGEFHSSVKESRREGEFHSSVKINDQILVSTQSRYSNIECGDRKALEAVFGNKTDEYFKSKMDIALTEAALADEKILQKLIAAVGQDNLDTYFKVKQYILPTDSFHELRTLNAEVGAKAKQLMDAGILKPYKAAVKVA